MHKAALLLLLASLYFADTARADTLYTYTGNLYNSCVGASYGSNGSNNVCQQPYGLKVTFETTVSGDDLHNLVLNSDGDLNAIGSNFVSFPVGDLTPYVSAFSFTDGTGFSITQANATAYDFDVTTDNKGNIQQWVIFANIAPPSGTGTFYHAETWNFYETHTPGFDYEDSSDVANEINGSFNEIGGGDIIGPSSPAQWTKTASPVPEPSSLLLLGTGLLSLGVLAMSQKKRFPA